MQQRHRLDGHLPEDRQTPQLEDAKERNGRNGVHLGVREPGELREMEYIERSSYL